MYLPLANTRDDYNRISDSTSKSYRDRQAESNPPVHKHRKHWPSRSNTLLAHAQMKIPTHHPTPPPPQKKRNLIILKFKFKKKINKNCVDSKRRYRNGGCILQQTRLFSAIPYFGPFQSIDQKTIDAAFLSTANAPHFD